MFHLRPQRLTTLVLLAAYLTATTLSGLLHAHGDHEHLACHHAAAEHSDHGHSDLGHGDHVDCDHDDATAQVVSNTDDDHHPDDCTLCRFVGQRVIPPSVVQLGTWCQLSALLAVDAVSSPTLSLARTVHSRAPPAVA